MRTGSCFPPFFAKNAKEGRGTRLYLRQINTKNGEQECPPHRVRFTFRSSLSAGEQIPRVARNDKFFKSIYLQESFLAQLALMAILLPARDGGDSGAGAEFVQDGLGGVDVGFGWI